MDRIRKLSMETMRLSLKTFALFIVFALILPFAKAQSVTPSDSNDDTLLLVVLPINERKVEFLKKSLTNKGLSESQRARNRKRLEDEKECRRLRRARLADALVTYFPEQKFVYVHPKLIAEFSKTGVLEYTIDPLSGNEKAGMNLSDRNVLLGTFGDSTNGEQLVDVFLLRDRDFNPIAHTSIRHPHVSDEKHLWTPEWRYRKLVKELKERMQYLARK